MGWYNNDWAYRRKHKITYATGAGTDYPIPITVHYGSGSNSGRDIYLDGDCRTDFGDIRFTDDDGETLLSFWMESKTDSDNAIFWVKVNDSLESEDQYIYIYYNNSGATYPSLATALAHGEATFEFFDDFSGTLSKWTTYGTAPTIVSGILTVAGSPSGCKVTSSSYGVGYCIRSRSKLTGIYGWVNAWTIYNTSLNDYSIIYTDSSANWRASVAKSASDETYTDSSLDSNYNIWENQRISSSSIKMYKNGASFRNFTDSSKIPTASLPPNFYTNGGGMKVEVDWVAVRKIVDPEPANSTWYDVETPAQEITKTITEYIGMIDIKSKYKSANKIISDYLGKLDTKLKYKTITLIFTELLGKLDSKLKYKTITLIFTELLGKLDSKLKYKSVIKTISELFGKLDIKSITKALNRIFTELLGKLDSKLKYKSVIKIISDYLGKLDIKSKYKSANRIFTDYLGKVDSYIRVKIINRIFTELLGKVDIKLKYKSINKIISEILGKVDSKLNNRYFNGVTRDSSGNPLGNCVVRIYRTSDNVYIGTTTSDGDGKFTILAPSGEYYFMRAHKAGTPNVMGVTDEDLGG